MNLGARHFSGLSCAPPSKERGRGLRKEGFQSQWN